jgi:hypothetical protein
VQQDHYTFMSYLFCSVTKYRFVLHPLHNPQLCSKASDKHGLLAGGGAGCGNCKVHSNTVA